MRIFLQRINTEIPTGYRSRALAQTYVLIHTEALRVYDPVHSQTYDICISALIPYLFFAVGDKEYPGQKMRISEDKHYVAPGCASRIAQKRTLVRKINILRQLKIRMILNEVNPDNKLKTNTS